MGQCTLVKMLLMAIVLLLSFQLSITKGDNTCISNYGQLKEALFDMSTSNKERLLYSVHSPNRPVPHYLWVYYINSQHGNWSNVLECPKSSILPRCPTDQLGMGFQSMEQGKSGGDEIVGIIFWGDSPLLITFDIPLLKAYTLDILLKYLGDGACVQLVIPPFCASVSEATKSTLLQFATTWVSLKTSSFHTRELNT